MNVEERQLLTESLGKILRGSSSESAREDLDSFGWFELLDEDPATAVEVLAQLQGEHLSPVTFLDDVLLASAGIPSGSRVILPMLAHSEPTTQLRSEILDVKGIMTAGDTSLVAPAHRGDEIVLAIVSADSFGDRLPTGEPAAIDSDSPWRELRVEIPVASLDLLAGTDAEQSWRQMRGAGQRMLASELLGVGIRMLQLAVAHVMEREQFGHKIGSFQAVKHALADVRVWQECVSVATVAAWEDLDPMSAQLAKTMAGRFVRLAAANCQQVMGGMGFTWEHDFHRYLRRALLLEPVLGSAVTLRTEIGTTLKSQGLPRLGRLG